MREWTFGDAWVLKAASASGSEGARFVDVVAATDWHPPAGAWEAAVREYLDRDRH